MQNKYVADVGDYGKYALLKSLCSRDLRCLVVWYLTDEDANDTDGKFREYLDNEKFRNAEPRIFDALKKMSSSIDGRNIGAFKTESILSNRTDYYEAELSYRGISFGDRRRIRDEWRKAAVEISKKADLVFLDPDNGLEVKSRGPLSKMGAKYATVEEVQAFLGNDKSVVLYQHRNRLGNIKDQVEEVFKRLAIRGCEPFGWAISFHTFSTRIYFVFPKFDHMARLEARLVEFHKNPNNQVFKLQLHRLNRFL